MPPTRLEARTRFFGPPGQPAPSHFTVLTRCTCVPGESLEIVVEAEPIAALTSTGMITTWVGWIPSAGFGDLSALSSDGVADETASTSALLVSAKLLPTMLRWGI